MSAREVVQAHVSRIACVNQRINALVVPLFEQALREAEAADARREQSAPLPPLHGLPITLKECLDWQDTPSTCGLAARRADRAAASDPHVLKLVRAGAIVIGKTNVPQALIFNESVNTVYGRTRNPWRLNRTPGGSSGGEAALIAAGGSPLGLGTDIGGSLRLPASFCGIVSLKPTTARLPDRTRYGAQPLAFGPVASVVGPMAREVDDLTLALRVLLADSPVGFTEPDLVDLRALRVAYYTEDPLFEPAPAVVRAVNESVSALRAHGAHVVPWTPPDVDEALGLYVRMLTADAAALIRQALGDEQPLPEIALLAWLARRSRRALRILTPLLRLLGQGTFATQVQHLGFSASDRACFVEEARAYALRFAQALDEAQGGPFDLIVCPVCFSPAWLHGDSRFLVTGGAYCVLYNLLGYPAGVAPVVTVEPSEAHYPSFPGLDVARWVAWRVQRGSIGLPVGVQVIARPNQEHLVLAALKAIHVDARRRGLFPATLPTLL
ncbi:MAG: amidase [Thermoflexales bacterium]|nr:amidase [Thermoflexales bacterium]MCX7938298.1 amidase [Thermoflexales bacterium]MDW8292274.1 amidase family protein [Anaerolineae bacterium]